MTDPKREAVLTTALLVVGTFVLGGALTTIVIKRTDPNWLESIGTLLAAAAAVYAAVLANRIAAKDRQSSEADSHAQRRQVVQLWANQVAEERHRRLQDLLVAFDRYAGIRWIAIDHEGEPDRYRHAQAEFTGHIRASTEALPHTRQIMFSHFGPPMDDVLDEWLAGYVESLGSVGDPELEPAEVLVIRGEILMTMAEVRAEVERLRAGLGSLGL